MNQRNEGAEKLHERRNGKFLLEGDIQAEKKGEGLERGKNKKLCNSKKKKGISSQLTLIRVLKTKKSPMLKLLNIL